MDVVDVSKWKRTPDFMKRYTSTTGSVVAAKQDIYVMFPAKFVDKGLSVVDTHSKILGVIAIYNDKGEYTVGTIPGAIDMLPNEIADIDVDGEHYIRLKILAGEPLFSSTSFLMSGDVVYLIFTLILQYGKLPWYLNYEDVYKVLANLTKYTGLFKRSNLIVFELLVAIISRSPKNKDVAYRTVIKTRKDIFTTKVDWIGLTDIYHSFSSTVVKLAGSYMKKGVVSSVVKESKTVSSVEGILRK